MKLHPISMATRVVILHHVPDTARIMQRLSCAGHRPRSGTRLGLALLTLALLHLSIAPALVSARQAAGEGTPSAPATTSIPHCDGPRADAAGLAAIVQQPAPEDPEAENPRGEPLPPAERAIVGDLVARWHGCLASGNLRGLLALFTADGARRLLADRSPYVGGPAGLRVSVLAVSDVVLLRDGRVAARVVVDPSGRGTAPPESIVIVIKQGEDGVWRFDHLRSPEGPIGAAGPAARDPDAPAPALLRHPIAPGPGVAIQAPGPTVPMRGGDPGRSGNQPGPIPTSEPRELWRAPTGWFSDAQPVVARGLVYFGGFSLGERVPLLAAIDAATGGVRWQTTAPTAWAEIPDAPALAGDAVFAPIQAPIAGVMAVVAGTGKPLWFAPFGFMSVTAPAVDADAVYVSGWGVRNTRDRAQSDMVGAVFALDQRTGRERWRFFAPARFGPVAVGAQALFVPSDHGLYALDRGTGRKRWQSRFAPGPKETPTAIGDLVVFTGSEITSGKSGIFALDARSGALRWRVDLPAIAGTRAGTAAAGDTLYVTWWESPDGEAGTGSPTLRAYELATGNERWIYRAGDQEVGDRAIGVGSITEPVIARERILFGVGIRVPAPGATGTLDGLYAVDAQSGALVWHAVPDTPIGSAPAVLDGVIYAMGGLRPRGDATRGSLIAFAAD